MNHNLLSFQNIHANIVQLIIDVIIFIYDHFLIIFCVITPMLIINVIDLALLLLLKVAIIIFLIIIDFIIIIQNIIFEFAQFVVDDFLHGS